jgi:hypothetical protein
MRRSGWEEPLEPLPLGVGEIAWIEWRHAVQRRSCRPCPSLQNTLLYLKGTNWPIQSGRSLWEGMERGELGHALERESSLLR